MGLWLHLKRMRRRLPAPCISNEQAIELATLAWEHNGCDGWGHVPGGRLVPFVREKLDEYAISFAPPITNPINPQCITVYHVNNQTGAVHIEEIDRWERSRMERNRLLLRPVASSTDTLLRPNNAQSSDPDVLVRSSEGDPEQGGTL